MYLCRVKSLFFFLALFILVKPTLPLLDFVANYQYIKNKLCENKDKPEMHCNGKCYLMKELGSCFQTGKSAFTKPKIQYSYFWNFFWRVAKFWTQLRILWSQKAGLWPLFEFIFWDRSQRILPPTRTSFLFLFRINLLFFRYIWISKLFVLQKI